MNIDGLPNNPHISRSELAELHEGAWQWAYSRLQGDREAADDVVQQVYLMILEGQARFDQRSSLKTWLYGVIRHAAHRQLRRRLRHKTLLANLNREVSANLDTPTIDPLGHTEQGMPAAMRAAISALPARQRDVLELTIYRDFSLSECASILGMRVGSVRTHYHRAKLNLRKQLKALDIDHD